MLQESGCLDNDNIHQSLAFKEILLEKSEKNLEYKKNEEKSTLERILHK